MTRTLDYDVVATSFPIVYTADGDHDPDGMLYTLRAYVPLLDWARERWEDDDRALPRLHRRRQLAQLVVDGLWRYEQMVDRLTDGPAEDRCLLHDLGGEADLLARGDSGDGVGAAERAGSPRAAEVRQNLFATVDELVAALDELTDGTVRRLHPDPAVRAGWRLPWQRALADLDRAVEARLSRVDDLFDADVLAARSGCLSADQVRRLLLNDHRPGSAGGRAHRYDRVNVLRPLPVVRPLVLRAGLGDEVVVRLENSVEGRDVGLHVQGSGPVGGVQAADGAHVGANPSSLVGPDATATFRWACPHEGAWPVNDLGDVRGTEAGTNAHGLFAAFVVEPAGAVWRDPETGEVLTGTAYADGPYVDVLLPDDPAPDSPADGADDGAGDPEDWDYVDLQHAVRRGGRIPAHREFTVFLHDEPEIRSGLHLVGEHTVMPLSYRAEPMPNRLPHRMRRYAERTARNPVPPWRGGAPEVDQTAVAVEVDDTLAEVFRTARTRQGEYLDRVAGEEQHHSSWLFGDPMTPVFRAYRGDPARVRVIHAGVKETHVFHLHVHQWRAVPQDTAEPSVWREGEPRGSQLLDSITIGPQTAVTIDPLYGSGSRQHLFGDVIWHCHLYPHFHHGMWGLWRSFDTLVDGSRALPDGTPTQPLVPLPGRRPQRPTAEVPGFPWFVDARFPQKSPPPPAVVDAHVGGRRRLLRMPAHSALELAAMPPGAKDRARSGAVFVDLDGDAVRWNAQAGLPPPRVVSYDVEVAQSDVEYNGLGWHDAHGHHYRITAASTTPLDGDGRLLTDQRVQHPVVQHGVEPFFPRANHGDVVELRLHNTLGTIPADDFDPTTPPVECGLHVHLVKFDVLAADGSSTGWNYLSGASCAETVDPDEPGRLPGNVGLHRWVVDEEFGPCFFHDHLLANYRQKHGLFAALVAEPPGAQWLRPDQEEVAWSGPEAVVLAPRDPAGTAGGDGTGGTGYVAYREACLAVGDFVPLYDGDGRPLNPPHELGGDDDPGSMGVNYRSSPLTARGDDPSQWFSSGRGEPDTPVVRTYAGERLRIRLIQGSHEEQHSFSAHGLRWRKEWHAPDSTLVDQQTVGISEAFTLDLDPLTGGHHGPGDHLWQFAALDDLWLGCWGLVRVLDPGPRAFQVLPPLPSVDAPDDGPARPGLQRRYGLPPRPHRDDHGRWSAPVREFVVAARRVEHEYDGHRLTDPWGLAFLVAEGVEPVGDVPGRPRGCVQAVVPETAVVEPLVLRARRGEWVHITLVNEVLDEALDDQRRDLPRFGVEPSPPRLPLEHTDDLGYPDERTVTPRVSLHPGLLLLDVVSDDGAYVGANHDGTVGVRAGERDVFPDGHGGHAGHVDYGDVVLRGHGAEGGEHPGGHEAPNVREYWWFADEDLAPAGHADGPGQVCLLRDVADVRNHRHHGLVGALVVEPGDVTPVHPRTLRERWDGTSALLVPTARVVDGGADRADVVANEQVLVVQDGLRHFVAGDPDSPVRDTVVGDDPEDAGQKGVNYRVAPVHPRTVLADPAPSTPVWHARVGDALWLRLVCAADKPRNHTFTVHGQAWDAAPWLARRDGNARTTGPWVGSLSGLTAGSVHTLEMQAREHGDHAYRSGAFRWAVPQGVWGILRVEPDVPGPGPMTPSDRDLRSAVGAGLRSVWMRLTKIIFLAGGRTPVQ